MARGETWITLGSLAGSRRRPILSVGRVNATGPGDGSAAKTDGGSSESLIAVPREVNTGSSAIGEQSQKHTYCFYS